MGRLSWHSRFCRAARYRTQHAAVTVDEESGSAAGQVRLLGGYTEDQGMMSAVHLVDLATGVCTPQPNLLRARVVFAAARMPHGCVVCPGGANDNYETLSSAEMLERPAQGATDATWSQTELPGLSVERFGCCRC
jgi:hypothetical protein